MREGRRRAETRIPPTCAELSGGGGDAREAGDGVPASRFGGERKPIPSIHGRGDTTAGLLPFDFDAQPIPPGGELQHPLDAIALLPLLPHALDQPGAPLDTGQVLRQLPPGFHGGGQPVWERCGQMPRPTRQEAPRQPQPPPAGGATEHRPTREVSTVCSGSDSHSLRTGNCTSPARSFPDCNPSGRSGLPNRRYRSKPHRSLPLPWRRSPPARRPA